MPSYRLTKSKFIRGLQCHKALYLDVFHKELAVIDDATRAKFVGGRRFEKSFKDTFPNGIDISQRLGMRIDRYPELTAQLLSQPGPTTLFEAGFIYNDVLVLADVLHKSPHGLITIYEVKNSSHPKDVFLHDVAIQHHVISHCLDSIAHFFLVYNDGNEGFAQQDLLDYAIQQKPNIAQQIIQMKDVLHGTEPNIPVGDHCTSPYLCPYLDYCRNRKGQLELSL